MNKNCTTFINFWLFCIIIYWDNKIIFVDKGKINHSKVNVSDFNYQNTSNNDLIVSNEESYEDILESVLKGTGR